MSSANAGWLFYKKMYEHLYISDGTRPVTLDSNYVDHVNSEILNTELVAFDYPSSDNSFSLTTLYPGLVIGTGYNHNAKDCNENFDFGFFFDHTTGMPLLPGSSIKGVIRSFFRKLDEKNQVEATVSFFKSIFRQSKISVSFGESTEEAIKVLKQIEKYIFDGINAQGKRVGLYDRDKFFDAYISNAETVKFAGSDKELIFADDYITPHYPNLMTEPGPNHMLKVRSGVTFKFNFELKDTSIDDSIQISAQQKLSLFQIILAFHGVGAKTNVGYGQFETLEDEEFSNDIETSKENITVDIFEYLSFKDSIENIKTAKSLKNKLKQAKKDIEQLDIKKQDELKELVSQKIIDDKKVEDDWYTSGLSNKKKKDLVGNDYFEARKFFDNLSS